MPARPETLSILACPHCALPLQTTEQVAICPTGHLFDRAREGYLNLLVGGRLATPGVAGDTPDALDARRRFLSAGWYQPIADALAHAAGTPDGAILDVGCGEGYYLSKLSSGHRYGVDISKRAIQMASRLIQDSQFVVASAHRLPILDHSCDVAISVFSPHSFDELQRVLRPGGKWITVTPGSQHLQEMRPRIDMNSERKQTARQLRRSQPPPEAASSEHVQFELKLTTNAARDLFSMTPLRWQSGARTIDSHDIGDDSASVDISVDVWVSTSS